MSHSLVACVLAAALSICIAGGCDLSPTMSSHGGTVLVWSIAKTDAAGQPVSLDLGTKEAMLPALQQRIAAVPGISTVIVTPAAELENAFQIELPGVKDPELINRVRRAIAAPGKLEFLILANRQHHSKLHDAVQNLAPAPQQFVVGPADAPFGKWLQVARRADQQGGLRIDPAQLPDAIFRNGTTGELVSAGEDLNIDDLQVLALTEDLQVTGADFAIVKSTFDANTGAPAISFTLTDRGAKNMALLTTRYTRDVPQGEYHHLAIVLDGEVFSAPRLVSAIAREGQITGEFTQEEVDFMVGIVKTGRLPARMEPQPYSEMMVQPDK